MSSTITTVSPKDDNRGRTSSTLDNGSPKASDSSVSSPRSRFDRPAVNPDDANPLRTGAPRKRLEQAGLADAGNAMHVHDQWSTLLEQPEKGVHLAFPSCEVSLRTF